MIRLLLLSLFLLTACRTIQKASSKNETALSDTQTSKYDREIVTEYIVRDTATGKPVIVNVMPSQPGQISTQQPLIIYRQTTRESGESSSDKTEEVKTETKETEASTPVEFRIASLILSVAVLLIALFLLIRLFKK